ncbi:MAG: YqgE/AlgH family protein [Burkholderiales bacterium]
MRASRLLLALALLAACFPAAAQQAERPNSVLLVARPELDDPNFVRTVLLVTQRKDGSTLGVILNRPTDTVQQGRPVWFGGPVLPESLIALFEADQPPAAAAFHVMKDVYLTMHPKNIDALLSQPKSRFRLYAGFAAWSPGQLEDELGRDAWYVLPADEALLFRNDPDSLWRELVAKAAGPHV